MHSNCRSEPARDGGLTDAAVDQGLRLRGPVLNTGTLRTGLIDGSAGATSPLSTHLPRLRLPPPPPDALGFFGFFGFLITWPLASVSGTRCSGSKSGSFCRFKV